MRRREFLKTFAVLAAGSMTPSYRLAGAQTADETPGEDLRDVLPVIGTGWHGHMFPGAVAPFGMVQASPDTGGAPEAKWNGQWDTTGWDHCSGYHYPDNYILGFSHTHLQGTGGADLGDVLLMPLVEGRNWSWNTGDPGQQAEAQTLAIGTNSGWVFDEPERGYRSAFSHDRETAQPGYYAVHLDTPDVHAELTATTRCGLHRYRYPALPATTRRGLIVDLVHGIGCEVYAAELHIESATRISGVRSTHGWATDKQVFFVIEVSRPFASAEVQVDGTARAASVGDHLSGKQIKVILTQSAAAEPLLVRVGISGTSVEGAAKNLAAEIPRWDFDGVLRANQREWSRALNVLNATLPDKMLQQTFATAAYHGLVAPATFNDVDGTYRGQDHRNYPGPGFTKYTTLSIWDIYRGEFPFLTLMQPHRIADIVKTMLADYRQLNQHSLPVWPLWGNETWCMTGFHVVGLIVGAYTRGLRDFDVEAAYAAMRDTAMVGAIANDNKALQEQFRSLGYVATGPQRQSVSRTLDFAYDYWCVGAMAELLGKQEDAAMFYKLGQNYKNLFDPATGFMRGRTEEGKWRDPFRPDREYWEDYTESDAWQATFNVMQDVQGLIGLCGGDQPFMAKLDTLYAAPSDVLDSPPDISGLVGQDAQGNEPSNHIPYLYTFAGAPWKTQERVRQVARLYNNTPQGVPGNDDCGQISTWFNFAALGFYPVNAVTGVYVLGSPLVSRATLRNPTSGTTFSVIAENNSERNLYVQSVELNGKPLTRSWFTHADILAGGALRFRMGSAPNKAWGAAPLDRPPSGLVAASR
ncbi:MAG TPA: GH92 family glycosyl hydrolase [Acidobacteriaceae bacterium]|jgi:predicted alpha-1,2-mannosidase|nr:GH92 family glycosyl hydrolase [Acidobacteriaceae bacterium]